MKGNAIVRAEHLHGCSGAPVYCKREVARGFTLIELMIVLAILGLLAMIAVPTAQVSVQRTKEAELRRSLRIIRTAIDDYKKAHDQGRIERKVGATGYPPNLRVLEEGVDDVRDPKRPTIYFLRRIPADPMFPDQAAHPADTWGKRSYASAPDEPKEGDDVFDVYSLSPGTGLNGVPYRRW
jgi:general secretion pathway protein G